MNNNEILRNLTVPAHPVDVVLDTDAYNEIDDQFAITYMLKSDDKLNVKAIYAAPFFNDKSSCAGDGMEKSYNEIIKVVGLIDKKIDIYCGSTDFLKSENEYIDSEAARNLVESSKSYSPQNPLYVIAIAAITNIASAILMDPSICDRIVVVWLGGNAHHLGSAKEFNMLQDYAAARVVMKSAVPFVQLPCLGVVSEFRISKPELEYWLLGKNKICDYLARNTIKEADSYAQGKPWTRPIWDVTAVAWLLNDNKQFMDYDIIDTLLPSYDDKYGETIKKPMVYVKFINRDKLMEDMINKLLR